MPLRIAPPNPRMPWIDESGMLSRYAQQWMQAFIPSFSDAEVPVGVIDGVNKVFTISHGPITGTLKLRKRAAAATSWTLMALTTGYTLSGITITYVTAPSVGDLHECDFRFLSPP